MVLLAARWLDAMVFVTAQRLATRRADYIGAPSPSPPSRRGAGELRYLDRL